MKSQRLQYLLLLLFLGASSFLFAIESRFTNEPSIESRFTDEPSDETSQELLSFTRQSRQQQESGELISLESIEGVNSRYASLNRGRLM